MVVACAARILLFDTCVFASHTSLPPFQPLPSSKSFIVRLWQINKLHFLSEQCFAVKRERDRESLPHKSMLRALCVALVHTYLMASVCIGLDVVNTIQSRVTLYSKIKYFDRMLIVT